MSSSCREAKRIVARAIGGGSADRDPTDDEKAIVKKLFDAGFSIGMFIEEIDELARNDIARRAKAPPARAPTRAAPPPTPTPPPPPPPPKTATKRGRSSTSAPKEKKPMSEASRKAAITKARRKQERLAASSLAARIAQVRRAIVSRNIPRNYIVSGTGIDETTVTKWIDEAMPLCSFELSEKVLNWYESEGKQRHYRFENMHPAAQEWLEIEFEKRGFLATRQPTSEELRELSEAATRLVAKTMDKYYQQWAAVSSISVHYALQNQKNVIAASVINGNLVAQGHQ